ncbi:endolytic transglycosylase MltG [Paracoccus sp. SCSIO 75233]|uniref:endolytic transglycosylase MltG n=1 Tax=Paracoccus sp. SCSIO 75233 TaxID=3017782 RepID=UPI0022F037FE|nr:endolytic transglycosylase MltG [Paracoccus sp. SCSIO 75233]WBU53831.1 endolytic transglycosylase MltG [Paracoccus sp. SCSIO 75233]
MWKNIVSNFLTLAVLLLVVAAGVVAWGRAQYSGEGPSEVAQCVQVARGASLTAVSKQLEAQGAISNAYIFRAGADSAGKSRDLKFGSYLVQPGASMASIVDVITEGGPSTCGTEVIYRIGVRADSVVLRDINPETAQYEERISYNPATEAEPEAITAAEEQPDARLRIAVAEGVTSWQIVEGLKRASFMSGEVSEVPAEGSLAPDSYEVSRNGDREALLALMAERQASILQSAWDSRPFGLPYDSPEEALIMASIVEKETGVPDERSTVASVFVNRLREGMRLETDPTVIYGVTEGRGVLDRGLRRSELDTRTDWNTYQIDGLPPTPIANPGRAAIEAALNPAETDYIFFVADGSGGHQFSRTLEEHNAAVARWREIEAERASQQGSDG